MERHTQRIYDEYLVSASIAGDADSLSRLVIRWQPRLFRHVWRMLGDIDRAKDVVQDVWMEILCGLPRLDDTAAFPRGPTESPLVVVTESSAGSTEHRAILMKTIPWPSPPR